MMLTDLPTDLVEEILFRVPATSVKRLRYTCKRWNALFNDRRFTQKHFRNAPRQPRVLLLKERRLCSVSVDLNVVPPSIEFKDELSIKNSYSNSSKQVDIAEVSHCDGLLLCVTRNSKVPVVWNPCSGETRWIQHENGYQSNSVFALGYENNQSSRSYKALVFSSCWPMDHDHDNGFEIYEFSSNSWRVVNAPNCIRIEDRGVTLKGNAYWISEDNDKNEYLLSFDFTRENFRRLCLPPPSQILYNDFRALSVVREEQLSVIQFGSSKTEMWVTKNINTTEADLSWSKSFAVRLVNISTSLLIDEEKKVALCCCVSDWRKQRTHICTMGEDDEYYTEIPYVEGSRWPFIFNYVPSLVQIESK